MSSRRPSAVHFDAASTSKSGKLGGGGKPSRLVGHNMIFQSMFQALNLLRHRFDDDFVDRLHYFYTCSMLIMMAVLVSFKQFGGRPLECWVPAVFTQSWEAYAEMYCWAQNTYWVPFNEDIPRSLAEREFREISYYQWVPFFLLLEALAFYVPCLIWRMLNGLSGIQLSDIVTTARLPENIEPEYRQRTIDSLSYHIQEVIRYQRSTATSKFRSYNRVLRSLRCCNLRYHEWWLTWLYLVVKVLYTSNVLLNLYLMNRFLETEEYSIYGVGVLYDLLRRKGWKDSGNFPRVTMCDFEIRVLGNIQRYTVQCVLVINIFTEKIFVLMWLWYSLLAVITLFDLIYWCLTSLSAEERLRFVCRHLEASDCINFATAEDDDESVAVRQFIDESLKIDGVFILRMIAAHAGVMACSEMMQNLWRRYYVRTFRRSSDLLLENQSLEGMCIGAPGTPGFQGHIARSPTATIPHFMPGTPLQNQRRRSMRSPSPTAVGIRHHSTVGLAPSLTTSRSSNSIIRNVEVRLVNSGANLKHLGV